MTRHSIKCIPPFFQDVKFGNKGFEIRFDDRDYRVGDVLNLQEYIPDQGYTGCEFEVEVTYILREFVGLKEGYVAMAIEPYSDIPF